MTFPSNTSHALQPLDITSCFKPFKNILKKARDETITINNDMEPNHITLVG